MSEVIYVGKQLIMVSSVTYAMKGMSILKEHGFSAEIVRTPRNGGKNGCGYSLYVKNNADEAEGILKEHGIKILGREVRGQ